MITTVIPFGASPINGTTNSRVWIDPVQNLAFVKRHYEITPAINISTATAKVTLYFTQAEFDDFNAVNSLKLPVSPTDASGISRLLIEKRSGITNDGTGSPGSYTGSIQNIDPLDALVLWNPLASRWEVSFDVIGFSGFFVKSQNVVLAAKWLSVSGNVNSQKKAVINWKVSEDNVAKYYLEKSLDGRVFNEISVEQSVGNGENEYQFTEQESLKGLSYYRITQIEKGGNKFSYSPIIKLGATNNQRINIFPNPAKEFASINVSNSLLNQKIYLLSLNGKLLETLRITNTFFTINLDKLAAGVYLLKMEDGSVNKIIKY